MTAELCTDLYFIIIYLMLSPTFSFATRDFVAKLNVGPPGGRSGRPSTTNFVSMVGFSFLVCFPPPSC